MSANCTPAPFTDDMGVPELSAAGGVHHPLQPEQTPQSSNTVHDLCARDF